MIEREPVQRRVWDGVFRSNTRIILFSGGVVLGGGLLADHAVEDKKPLRRSYEHILLVNDELPARVAGLNIDCKNITNTVVRITTDVGVALTNPTMTQSMWGSYFQSVLQYPAENCAEAEEAFVEGSGEYSAKALIDSYLASAIVGDYSDYESGSMPIGQEILKIVQTEIADGAQSV